MVIMEQLSYSEMPKNLLTAVEGYTVKQVKELFEFIDLQKDDTWFDYTLVTYYHYNENIRKSLAFFSIMDAE